MIRVIMASIAKVIVTSAVTRQTAVKMNVATPVF
jgi:hypothetical protein